MLLLLSGCGGADDEVVLVFAAASLADAFSEIEAAFEDQHDGVDVQLNLAGSSSLREQIIEGAPADVFAAAASRHVEMVADAGLAGSAAVPFVVNRMVLAVPVGNPGGVTGLEDLGDEALLVGLCAAQVPCGEYADAVLDAAGVTAVRDTEEANVRSLLTKLEAGELDAGIVYETDVATSDLVEAIEIDAQVNVVAVYPIMTLGPSPSTAAEAYVGFVLSLEGGSILQRHGFGAP